MLQVRHCNSVHVHVLANTQVCKAASNIILCLRFLVLISTPFPLTLWHRWFLLAVITLSSCLLPTWGSSSLLTRVKTRLCLALRVLQQVLMAPATEVIKKYLQFKQLTNYKLVKTVYGVMWKLKGPNGKVCKQAKWPIRPEHTVYPAFCSR